LQVLIVAHVFRLVVFPLTSPVQVRDQPAPRVEVQVPEGFAGIPVFEVLRPSAQKTVHVFHHGGSGFEALSMTCQFSQGFTGFLE
jgi:hypothetical protein